MWAPNRNTVMSKTGNLGLVAFGNNEPLSGHEPIIATVRMKQSPLRLRLVLGGSEATLNGDLREVQPHDSLPKSMLGTLLIRHQGLQLLHEGLSATASRSIPPPGRGTHELINRLSGALSVR